MRPGILTVLAAGVLLAAGCADSEVTQSDVAANRKEFSQENYEQAMIKAGKSKELAEERARNAAYNQGQPQTEGQQ